MLKNVTITLDEETARWARLEAARREMSVSRLVGEILRERMLADAGYEAAMKDYLSRPRRALRDPGERLPTRDEIYER